MFDAETVRLGTWPTPLEPAPRLAVAIGMYPDDLWIKRDDLTGLGLGGNKVRKLEWLSAEAMRSGATMLVTSGAAQSNHARLTAAAGARLGISVTLVLRGSDTRPSRGNVILDELFGAAIVWSNARSGEELDAHVQEVADDIRRNGHRPEVIPFGGSTALSANGYETAADEILAQGPPPEHVVIPLGSGATMAGLVRRLGPSRVLGVHCGAVDDPASVVTTLVDRSMQANSALPLRIRDDQVGRGYAHLSPMSMEAMALAARTEGIVLDPTYTGRSLAGLMAEVKEGHIRPGQRTVWVHTGGVPGLFGHSEIADGISSPR